MQFELVLVNKFANNLDLENKARSLSSLLISSKDFFISKIMHDHQISTTSEQPVLNVWNIPTLILFRALINTLHYLWQKNY